MTATTGLDHRSKLPGLCLATHRALLLAVLLSVGLHVALLFSKGISRLAGATAMGPSMKPIQLRLAPQVAITTGTPLPPKAGTDIDNTTAGPEDTETAPENVTESTAHEVRADGSADTTVGPRYYRTDELTAKPVFLRDDGAPTPTFIPDVLPLPVMVSIYINEQGSVDDVVLSESFLSDIAKKFIVDSFIAMQFSPGMLGTLPVKSVLKTEVKLPPALSPR